MKLLRFVLIVTGIALVFVVGFGYGRWYSTRPAVASRERRVLYYVDPMHPAYRSDKPGIAPDCGMKLEPVYADEPPNLRTGNPASQPPSANAIHVSADQQQLIGLRYGEAEWSALGQTIHAMGRVTVDETRVVRVQARSDGWIDKVWADFTGKLIEKRQPLLTLYSPELLATQKELLLALRARTAMRQSSMEDSMVNSEALVQAARQRLQLLNLTDSQIDEIERTQRPVQSVTLYSPANGYIVTRNAFPGQRVTAETELYALADLSQVWVMADVFESDVPQIQMGQSAMVMLQGTGTRFSGKISYIQPQLDPVTRTMKVRVELPNPGLRLKPDMFVAVDFSARGARRLTVPAEAVLDAGTTKTIFLDRGNGFFEPRQVETGDRAGDRVEILKGLAAGERIVTSGVFLLNSESQLRSPANGGSSMPGMPGMSGAPASPGKDAQPQPQSGRGSTDMPDMPGMPARNNK